MNKRTDAKIRYARAHLDSLRKHPSRGSRDDFECANQEAALYHLVGAKDALLQEINVYLGCSLPPNKIYSAKSLKKVLPPGTVVPALGEIESLESDANHWFALLRRLRNQCTHRGDVSREFFIGSREHEVHLADPRCGNQRGIDIVDELETWISEMENLVRRTRVSFGIK